MEARLKSLEYRTERRRSADLFSFFYSPWIVVTQLLPSLGWTQCLCYNWVTRCKTVCPDSFYPQRWSGSKFKTDFPGCDSLTHRGLCQVAEILSHPKQHSNAVLWMTFIECITVSCNPLKSTEIMLCTLHTSRKTHYTLHTARCTLYIAHCTLHAPVILFCQLTTRLPTTLTSLPWSDALKSNSTFDNLH